MEEKIISDFEKFKQECEKKRAEADWDAVEAEVNRKIKLVKFHDRVILPWVFILCLLLMVYVFVMFA